MTAPGTPQEVPTGHQHGQKHRRPEFSAPQHSPKLKPKHPEHLPNPMSESVNNPFLAVLDSFLSAFTVIRFLNTVNDFVLFQV